MGSSRQLCVAVDVEAYRSRTVPQQRAVQQALAALARSVWAGVGGVHQPNGDGAVTVVTGDPDEAEVLATVLQRFHTGLAEINDEITAAATTRRIRLRLAAHTGHVETGANGFVGHAVVRTCRLLDSTVLRHALVDHPAADLAVLVSETLHEDVVSQESHGLHPETFRRVEIVEPGKEFRSHGYLLVPGTVAVPPATRSPAPGPVQFRVDVAAGGQVGNVVQAGEVHDGIHLHLPPATS